jgi:hypothetical protein
VAIDAEREWINRARIEVDRAAEWARWAGERLEGIPRRHRADRATAADLNAATTAEAGWRAELAKHQDQLAVLEVQAAEQADGSWLVDAVTQ